MLILPNKPIILARTFLQKNLSLYHRYMMKRITSAVRTNADTVDLFSVEDTGYVGKLEKKYFKKALTDAMKYFVEKEEYENASIARKLLQRLAVNNLISEIKKPETK